MKRVTIKDIAEALNISRGTVDRVLHGRGGVNPETEALVWAKVREMNYQPNKIARALVKQVSYTIGFIIPTIPDSFWRQVREGAEAAAREVADFGVKVTFYTVGMRDPFRERALLEQALSDGVNGIALTPTDPLLIREIINQACEKGVPVVTFNTDIPDSQRLCYVGLDSYRAGRVAGELMRKFLNGQGEIAILTGFLTTQDTEVRRQGFLEVVTEKGENKITIIGTWENMDDDRRAYQLTRQIIRDFPDLQGIFVTNACAAGIGTAIIDEGRAGDVKLIGFDVTEEIAALLKKGVVSACICQNTFQQGYEPVRLIFDYVVNGLQPEFGSIFTRPEVILAEMLEEGLAITKLR
ncbi:HTH-type transcriptional repressor PurR [Neomoorella glycerini]|uniref:HTH-type transcriptional repressor PurR n=1 Tax=Neomoorella glycerini TaxID=55779 RepID=A0A6I5ZMK4_9FIRM|nr:substrate-binding domain-containing protein [Moorella glycerini]QGP90845.1 HTH-type transcriptional repressor PurR [Moorella glycerini]